MLFLDVLSLICNKSALQSLVIKQEKINLTGIMEQISPDILDSQYPVNNLQKYFTKYGWSAVEKKGTSIYNHLNISLYTVLLVEALRKDWACSVCPRSTSKLNMVQCDACDQWFHW